MRHNDYYTTRRALATRLWLRAWRITRGDMWTDKGNGPTGRSIDTGKGYGFSMIFNMRMSSEEIDATVRTVTAAPDMLELLQLIVSNARPIGDGIMSACTLDIESAERLIQEVTAK